MKRREFAGGLASAFTLSFAGAALAEGAPTEGKQYAKISPPAPVAAAPGNIDVVEFFSYACPHCNAFEPVLHEWVKRQPADVQFRRVPANFLTNAENFQRIYYSLEAMNLLDTLHTKVFHAVHVDRERLMKPDEISAFVTKHGVDAAKFMSVFSSFGVQAKVRHASKLIDQYKIDGIPAVAVQGRYVTSPGQAGGHEQALQVVEHLIQQARAAR